MDQLKITLLKWWFSIKPPSLIDARKTVNLLSPDCDLVYFALYADGCKTSGMATREGLYFEGYEGPKHAPHKSFSSNDKPIYEWGIKGLKYGDKVPK